MVRINERAGRARQITGMGSSPVVRDEQPQNFAVPGEKLDYPNHADNQTTEQRGHHNRATDPSLGFKAGRSEWRSIRKNSAAYSASASSTPSVIEGEIDSGRHGLKVRTLSPN